MNIKKIISLLLLLMLMFTLSVSATYVQMPYVDISDNTVTITGKTPSGLIGKTVTMLVFNVNKDINDLPENSLALQKPSETLSQDGGVFTFRFPVNYQGDNVSGTYKVYVSGEDFSAPEVTTFYFAVPQDRKNAIIAINDSETSALMFENLNNYVNTLFLHSVVFDAIEKTQLAQKLYNKVQVAPFDSETPGILQEWVREQSLVEAYNQSLTNLIYDTAGTMQYMDVLQFSGLDSLRNLSVYNIYTNIMSDLGRVAVRSGMQGMNCQDIEALRTIFIKQSVINGIKKPQNGGFGHVHSLLTVNGTAAGLDLTEYNALDDTGNVDRALVSLTFNSIAELQTRIDELVNQPKKTPTSSTTSNGGGGFSVSVDIPVPTPTVSPQPTVAPSSLYNDVEGMEWALAAITTMTEKGIVNGMGDGSFKPNEPVTREQFAKMLARVLKLDVSDNNSGFDDVSNNEWYAPYITVLKKNGIIKGKGNSFGTGESITRENVAVMAFRAITMVGLNVNAGKEKFIFTDDTLIADYAREAVTFLSNANIISGMGDGSFVPQGICTRAQAVKIIYQLIK